MKTIFIISVFLFTAVLFSQEQGRIKGTVTDKSMNNEPILFATVQLKGSDVSNQTNFHGNFEITGVPSGRHTLVIRYAGYTTEEIEVVVIENKVSEIKTNLSPLQISFDDVVGMNVASKEGHTRIAAIEKSRKE